MRDEFTVLPVIDLDHEKIKSIILWSVVAIIFIGAIFGIYKYEQHQEALAKQHILISKIVWHDEVRQNFTITKLTDDTTTEDIVLPTGVPSTKTDVATEVTYSDGSTESISTSVSKLQPLLNKTYSFRTSQARYATIYGKIKESGVAVKQDINNVPFKVGDKIIVSDFRKLEYQFDDNNGNGNNAPQDRSTIIEQIADNNGNQ